MNIAYYRKLKSVSQEELAEMTGISRTTIANIENSNKYQSMSLSTVFRIADALKVPVKKLFDFRDEDD
ncbi:MAG: helix-turn-helix domain-containing protein [Defluviitaleaceae bacterium]|nr:helix-turn-helix domain-containing protein [Defluviitaleaceae bacterium]